MLCHFGAAMKILSDFDGARTNQALGHEARVLDAPERYGWAPDGRITACVDEGAE